MTTTTWLSPEDYSKGEPFMLEKTSIFAHTWLPLCAASQLAQHGDYMSATIGGWPLFAIRDSASIRAFRNICRHQNMMIVEKPAGRCDVLQCRYHGWQYGLDGRFIAAPPLVAPADAASPNNHLAPLATTEWLGLIFGSLLDVLLPTSMAFADLAAASPDAENQGQEFVHAQTTDVACNWKTFVERRLADQWTFQWPMLTVLAKPGAVIVEQVVPRSFVRTRVVSMVLCPESNRAEFTASAARAIQDAVPQIEAIQHRYENGDTQAIDVPAAHAFRARVRSATRG
ncbi:MAG: aromatic ring-hydroxylating oxygenase subunit alpha [Burkholderiales bacterium]